MTTFYRTIDFRPAPPGWRLVYLLDPAGLFYAALPGWLIQEAVPIDEYEGERFDEAPAPENRLRQIVAAAFDGADLIEAGENLWCILGPGEPEPTAAEEAREREERAKARAYTAARRAAKASPSPVGDPPPELDR